jgi:hypothetical protein
MFTAFSTSFLKRCTPLFPKWHWHLLLRQFCFFFWSFVHGLQKTRFPVASRRAESTYQFVEGRPVCMYVVGGMLYTGAHLRYIRRQGTDRSV